MKKKTKILAVVLVVVVIAAAVVGYYWTHPLEQEVERVQSGVLFHSDASEAEVYEVQATGVYRHYLFGNDYSNFESWNDYGVFLNGKRIDAHLFFMLAHPLTQLGYSGTYAAISQEPEYLITEVWHDAVSDSFSLQKPTDSSAELCLLVTPAENEEEAKEVIHQFLDSETQKEYNFAEDFTWNLSAF